MSNDVHCNLICIAYLQTIFKRNITLVIQSGASIVLQEVRRVSAHVLENRKADDGWIRDQKDIAGAIASTGNRSRQLA